MFVDVSLDRVHHALGDIILLEFIHMEYQFLMK
jgi:hypothetical protein